MSLFALLQTRLFWASVPKVFYWGLGMIVLVFVLLWMVSSRGDSLEELRQRLSETEQQVKRQEKVIEAAERYIHDWDRLRAQTNQARQRVRHKATQPDTDLRADFYDALRVLHDAQAGVPSAPGAGAGATKSTSGGATE